MIYLPGGRGKQKIKDGFQHCAIAIRDFRKFHQDLSGFSSRVMGSYYSASYGFAKLLRAANLVMTTNWSSEGKCQFFSFTRSLLCNRAMETSAMLGSLCCPHWFHEGLLEIHAGNWEKVVVVLVWAWFSTSTQGCRDCLSGEGMDTPLTLWGRLDSSPCCQTTLGVYSPTVSIMALTLHLYNPSITSTSLAMYLIWDFLCLLQGQSPLVSQNCSSGKEQ